MALKEETILAKCKQMCPPSECCRRGKDNLIHILETDYSCGKSKNRKADPTKMVKSYCRSAVGQTLTNPDLLRPPHVLKKTMQHLLEKVIHDDRLPRTAVYDFINDRLRSVKQDGVIQRLSPKDWFEILPPIIRFYGYSAYWFSEEPVKQFDQKLNKDQLIDCLLLYITNFEQNAYQKYAHDYAEIEALYLIVNIDPETINRAVLLNLPDMVFQATLKLILKWYGRNYTAVFRLLLKLPPLPACLFTALHLSQVRKEFFRVLSYGYSCKNVHYPVELLKANFLFNSNEEVLTECRIYGIAVDLESNTVCFEKGSFRDSMVPSKKVKVLDEKLKTPTTLLLLQNRANS